MSTLVHLVYIHGFQGNDTTFQSFPKHLQEHLETRIPRHLDITIQSSLYPTYKSVKPISHATKNFLEWLSTQPPGPVILLGHSMGGLLAADAATDPSNNPDRHGGKPKRIVGVVAFDTPYLGMHPHVVVSGIASLLPKGDASHPEKKQKSEIAMNQHPQVKIIDGGVTDDWEAFKTQANVHPKNAPFCDSKSLFTHSSKHSQDSSLSLPLSQSSSSSLSESSSFIERALTKIGAKDDDPLVRWLRKHAEDPFSAGRRWVVERFQFGICMFDPAGLKTRYSRLVEWGSTGGVWVNYWTTTVSHTRHHGEPIHEPIVVKEGTHEHMNNDESLVANGIIEVADNPEHSGESVSGAKAVKKAAHDQLKDAKRFWTKQEDKQEKEQKSKKERHFVVLPNGLGEVLGGMEKWENIPIGGVEDEVNAHTGLFIPKHNLNYEAFVEQVCVRVLEWCEPLHQRGNSL